MKYIFFFLNIVNPTIYPDLKNNNPYTFNEIYHKFPLIPPLIHTMIYNPILDRHNQYSLNKFIEKYHQFVDRIE
jgi:hypothetical protein